MAETLMREKVTKLSQESMDELKVVFFEYSERKGFPDACCIETSKDIAKNLGFRYREGHFELDFPNEKGISKPTHVWCEDEEGTIIDLTAHQFNTHLKEKLPVDVLIVRPKNLLYSRYSPA